MLLRACLVLVLGSIAACGHAGVAKLAVDTPALPYTPPDIDELTGIDSDAPPPAAKEEPAAKGTPPAPAPAPTPKK